MFNFFNKKQSRDNGVDEIVLRTAYAFNKSISLGQKIMTHTFQVIKELKDIPKNDELDFSPEQGQLLSK